MTLIGRGRNSRLTLTESGTGLASQFATGLHTLWSRAIHDLPESRVTDALRVLGLVSGRPVEVLRPTCFPIELIAAVDCAVAQTVDAILKFTELPGLRDGALRPLLLLANGTATPTALGSELGVGAPAVNVALAPAHRAGLVEWQQKSLRLTDVGERVVRRITLAPDVFWHDVEQAGGGQALGDAHVLLAGLGRGFPASART